MTRATLRKNFNVKRSKVRVTGRLTQTHRMCHIFQTVCLEELQSWYADGGRRPASAASAMTSNFKGQGHKVTWAGHTVSAEPGGHTSCFSQTVRSVRAANKVFFMFLGLLKCKWPNTFTARNIRLSNQFLCVNVVVNIVSRFCSKVPESSRNRRNHRSWAVGSSPLLGQNH